MEGDGERMGETGGRGRNQAVRRKSGRLPRLQEYSEKKRESEEVKYTGQSNRLSSISDCKGLSYKELSEEVTDKPEAMEYSMNTTLEHDARMAKLTFASVYPHYITKVERKGRTKEELLQVIEWLTGYDDKKLQNLIDEKVTFETFFANAKLNTNAHLIKGVICGFRIEDIKNPLTKQVRYLDKLVDELAKGRKMEKILREA